MELAFLKVGIDMKELGKMIKKMEKDSIILLMVIYMWEISEMI